MNACLLDTQEVRGSSPLSPTLKSLQANNLYCTDMRNSPHVIPWCNQRLPKNHTSVEPSLSETDILQSKPHAPHERTLVPGGAGLTHQISPGFRCFSILNGAVVGLFTMPQSVHSVVITFRNAWFSRVFASHNSLFSTAQISHPAYSGA